MTTVFQPRQERKKQAIKSAACLPAVALTKQVGYFQPGSFFALCIHIPVRVLPEVLIVHIGLKMKSEFNVPELTARCSGKGFQLRI